MAPSAAASLKNALAARGVAGPVEKTHGIEVSEEIGRRLVVHIRRMLLSPRAMALHMAGAWFHMVAASAAGVKLRSAKRPRSGAVPPRARSRVAHRAGKGTQRARRRAPNRPKMKAPGPCPPS